LFLNWRDSANPSAGGAETFTEEIGKRLVSSGNDVTIFSSSFLGSEPKEYMHGIRMLRGGGKYSVYAKARSYLKSHLSEFDVVVDEINTVPFRAHNLVKKVPMVAVIHQLAREVWFYETRFPINLLGYLAFEPLWLRGYRSIPTITVSNSTKQDLLDRGFTQVHVIHNGIGVTHLEDLPVKEKHPVLIFLGRLVRSKLPEHAIAAFKYIRAWFPDAELWVIGDGYMRRKLEKDSSVGVRFFGRVNEEEKFDLLKRAHVLLVPSVREGWGISIIEANSVGTPAVGYAVPGLVDSIVDGVTGILVPPRKVEALADAARRVLIDSYSARTFSEKAIDWSKKFSWDDAAEKFYDVLNLVVNKR
jgi:glycosyltransferase involved in cell wall biosynthesis